MSETSINTFNADSIAAGLERASKSSDGWVASCPCPDHEDANPSFSIRDGDTEPLIKCHGGCERDACIAALRDQGLWPAKKKKPVGRGAPKQQVACYDYTDENGELIYQVVRYKPKSFRQRVVNDDGSYTWSLKDVEKTYPYRVADFHTLHRKDRLGTDRAICIFEGEKDADAAHEIGMLGTTFPNGAGKWRDEWAEWFAGRRVYIVPDQDSQGMDHARMIASKLYRVVEAKGLKIITLPNPKNKNGYDFSDYIADGGNYETFGVYVQTQPIWKPESMITPTMIDKPLTDKPTAAILTADFEHKKQVSSTPYIPSDPQRHWTAVKRALVTKSDGTMKPRSLTNARIFLESHPDMVGCLGWNMRTNSAWMLKQFPWDHGARGNTRQLIDTDKVGASEWLEKQNIEREGNIVVDLMEKVAQIYPFDYLMDYLNALEWDQEARMSGLLHNYFGAADTPLNSILSNRFMIGAAARAMKPGCKNDTMLVLEGNQGIKKSTGLETLFGAEYFCDQLPSLSKAADAAMQLAGHWCVEVQEMNTMNKADYNRIKEFLGVKEDKYRAPFGRHPICVKRGCVIVGTINPETGYLKDPTGGRRFWPVECSKVDIKALAQDRDQLWAEAVHLLNAGAKWWFDGDDDEQRTLRKEQGSRFAFDVWAEEIGMFAAQHDKVTTKQIATECIGMPLDKVTPMIASRISKTLVALGYKAKRDATHRYFKKAPRE